MALNAIRIGSDLDSFLNEHPEIKIARKNGKIVSIRIPEDALIFSLNINSNELISLEYFYEGKLWHYPI